jgi:hypothetical protein
MTDYVIAKQLMALGFANDLRHESAASNNVTHHKSGTEAAFVFGSSES